MLSKQIVRLVCLAVALLVAFLSVGSNLNGDNNNLMLADAKKTDILFLKGKFVLRDKKGSIVISDEKKPCHCGYYYK